MEAAARGEDVSIDTEVHSYSYDDILSLRFRLLTNTDCFVRQDGQWVDKSDDEAYLLNVLNSSDEIAVVGILRPAEGATTGSGQSGVIGYRADLMTHLLDKVTSAEIVREQQAAPTVDVFTGLPFEQEELKDAYTMEELQAYAAQLPAAAQQELMGYVSSMQAAGMDDGTIATQLMRAALSQSDGATYTGNLKRLGVSDPDDPEAINLFPKDFEAKDRIADRIAEYNKTLPEDAQLAYTDYIGLMISSITTIINAISYILIAFVAVSLVVSSIMIGIITYISVLERTREIGVLRSIGASRRDISRVFNAETLTIGFAAGTIGIGITLLLILPLNAIIRHLSGLSGVAALPAGAAVILVAISMLLTFLAGLIPSRIAAKRTRHRSAERMIIYEGRLRGINHAACFIFHFWAYFETRLDLPRDQCSIPVIRQTADSFAVTDFPSSASSARQYTMVGSHEYSLSSLRWNRTASCEKEMDSISTFSINASAASAICRSSVSDISRCKWM